MTTEYRPIADYPKNALNKTNTFENSGIARFMVGDTEFAMGFWETPNQNDNSVWPYLALISWTSDGWVVVGRLAPLWNDDLNMHNGSASEDIKTYAWYIGDTFTPLMQQYIVDSGGVPVVKKNWERIRELLNGVQFINGEIVVSHE